MQFLTAIKHFEIYFFLLFLLAIVYLIHPLSNNRSPLGLIGCYKFAGALLALASKVAIGEGVAVEVLMGTTVRSNKDGGGEAR